jgi:hypothetical protein
MRTRLRFDSLTRMPPRALSRFVVVGPKVSDKAVIPSSICNARVSAYIVRQPVTPFSFTG